MAKTRKRKPSFDAPVGDAAIPGAAWVYRSDADAPLGVAAVEPEAPCAEPVSPSVLPGAGPTAPAVTDDRRAGAQRLVDRYARYSAAAGLVPLPVLDLAAIAGVQVALLGALAAHYGVPYSRARGRVLVTALLGGLMPSLAGHQVLKVVGPLVGMISISGFAMASTHAIGRLFVGHFEAGGTLLDLDVDRSRLQVEAQITRR